MTISYFGFPADEIVVCKAKERGAWVVEDASQALLMDEAATAADFVLFSPAANLSASRMVEFSFLTRPTASGR